MLLAVLVLAVRLPDLEITTYPPEVAVVVDRLINPASRSTVLLLLLPTSLLKNIKYTRLASNSQLSLTVSQEQEALRVKNISIIHSHSHSLKRERRV